MTSRSTPIRLACVAKAAAQTTPAPNAHGAPGSTATAARHGDVQWGQANGCCFRFDPQADPRRSNAAPSQPTPRRLQPLPVRRATEARAARSAGRARQAKTSLGPETGFDANIDRDRDPDADADDESASITAASSAQGAHSQDQGAQDGQDEQSDGDGRHPDTNGYPSSTTARPDWPVGAAPSTGRVASIFDNDSSASPMLRALAAGPSSLSLRQRVLAAMAAPAKTQRCAKALGHVRAALIEAVDAGVLVPKLDANSPDQNCLIPLLLLRALRPMPPTMRAQTGARVAAMLSMAGRACNARRDVLVPGSSQ
jgi:hypothetical protein